MPHEAPEHVAERLRVHHRAHRAAIILEDDFVAGKPAQLIEFVPHPGDVSPRNEIWQEYEAVITVPCALLPAQSREIRDRSSSGPRLGAVSIQPLRLPRRDSARAVGRRAPSPYRAPSSRTTRRARSTRSLLRLPPPRSRTPSPTAASATSARSRTRCSSDTARIGARRTRMSACGRLLGTGRTRPWATPIGTTPVRRPCRIP